MLNGHNFPRRRKSEYLRVETYASFQEKVTISSDLIRSRRFQFRISHEPHPFLTQLPPLHLFLFIYLFIIINIYVSFFGSLPLLIFLQPIVGNLLLDILNVPRPSFDLITDHLINSFFLYLEINNSPPI